MQLEVSEGEMMDPEAQTDHEVLPDGRFVLIRDVCRALDGEPFKVFPPEGGMPEEYPGMDPVEVSEYLTLFHRYKTFGLPHGRGWIREQSWVVDLIEFLDMSFERIQAWRMGKGPKTTEVSPERFGVED